MSTDIKINPNGFREYDARWLYEKDINLSGLENLGKGLGTQIIKNINKRKTNIGILGLGYVGLPLAIRFSEEKFKVVGRAVIKELERKQDFLLLIEQCGRQPADLFVAYDTFCIDEKGFRNPVNTIIHGDVPGGIIDGKKICLPKLPGKCTGVFLTVLDGNAQDGEWFVGVFLFLMEGFQDICLTPAFNTPGSPEIKQYRSAQPFQLQSTGAT